MTEERHRFTLQSAWYGDSDGDGTLTLDGGSVVEYGVPAALGGKANRTNPEQLLLAAVVACYSITLALLIEKRRLSVEFIETMAEGDVARQPDRSLTFVSIRLRPRLTLPDGDETKRKSLEDLAQRAERHCLVSRALHGNVAITVEPQISASEAALLAPKD
jgi:peroxiredoxin-like protein